MRLRQYLNEAKGKVEISNGEITFPDHGTVSIPFGKEVILIKGDVPHSIEMVAISASQKVPGKIMLMKGKDTDWYTEPDLEKYLNSRGYTIFQGFNRF